MKKLKKTVCFSLKWVCLPICILCVIASLFIAGYNVYLKGEYYGKAPKCLYTRQLTIKNSTANYAIIQIDHNITSRYNIVKDITCNDFDRIQSDKSLRNVFNVSGVSYAFVFVLNAIGTILLWGILSMLIVCSIVIPEVYIIDFVQREIELWIERGKPSKRWQMLVRDGKWIDYYD